MGISAEQFRQMEERLGRSSRRPSPVIAPVATVLPNRATLVLGLDPSLRGTGYGIIRVAKPVPETLIHGTIRCASSWARSRCLAEIATTLRGVLKQYPAELCVIEGIFYAQNLQTAMIMGEARGAALAAIAEAGAEIVELAPRKVKQAIVGYGAAGKDAVAKMVQRMLRLPEPPAPDAADALALALAHVQSANRYSLARARSI